MKARTADRRPGQLDRFQVGDGRQRAELADLNVDADEFGQPLLGSELGLKISTEDKSMPVLEIPEDILKLSGLSEREAIVEFACHLFDAGKLPLWPAAKLAGLSRVEMEAELRERKIAIYRPSLEDFAEDMVAIKELRKG